MHYPGIREGKNVRRDILKGALLLFLLFCCPLSAYGEGIWETETEIQVKGRYDFSVPDTEITVLEEGRNLIPGEELEIRVEDFWEEDTGISVAAVWPEEEVRSWLQSCLRSFQEDPQDGWKGFYLGFYQEQESVRTAGPVSLSMKMPGQYEEIALFYINGEGQVRELPMELKNGRLYFQAEQAGYYLFHPLEKEEPEVSAQKGPQAEAMSEENKERTFQNPEREERKKQAAKTGDKNRPDIYLLAGIGSLAVICVLGRRYKKQK